MPYYPRRSGPTNSPPRERYVPKKHHEPITKEPIDPQLVPSYLEKVRAFPWPWAELAEFTWSIPRAIEFTLYTGIHPNVLVHARWRELHVQENRAYWKRPKTGAEIPFPLSPEFRAWVPDFIRSLPPDHCNEPFTCGALSVMPITRAFQKVSAEIGFPGVGPRTLRHTAIRMAFERGANVPTVKRLFGCTDRVAIEYSMRAQPGEFERRMLAGEV